MIEAIKQAIGPQIKPYEAFSVYTSTRGIFGDVEIRLGIKRHPDDLPGWVNSVNEAQRFVNRARSSKQYAQMKTEVVGIKAKGMKQWEVYKR